MDIINDKKKRFCKAYNKITIYLEISINRFSISSSSSIIAIDWEYQFKECYKLFWIIKYLLVYIRSICCYNFFCQTY